MTASGCIMVLVHQTSTKVIFRGDDDTRRVELVDGVRQKIAIDTITHDRIMRGTRRLCERSRCRITQKSDDPGVKGLDTVGSMPSVTQVTQLATSSGVASNTECAILAPGECIGKNVNIARFVLHDEIEISK